MNLTVLLMFMIFIVGIILIVLAFMTYNKLRKKCSTKKLQAHLRIILGIGSALVSLGLGYLLCRLKCNCERVNGFGKKTVLSIMIMLSVLLTSLSSLLYSDINKQGCDENVKQFSLALIITSVVLIVGCSILFYKSYTKGVLG